MKRTLWHAIAVLLFVPSLGWAQSSIDTPIDGGILTGALPVAGFFCLPLGLEPGDVALSMSFDGGGFLPVSYGNSRGDTAGVCGGEIRNGFVSQWNYNILGDGQHTVRLFADTGAGPVEFGSSTFSVVTLGEEFAIELPTPRVTVNNWPSLGERIQLEWKQSLQDWSIVSADDENVTGEWRFDLLSLTHEVCVTMRPQSAACEIPTLSPFVGEIDMLLDIEQGEGSTNFSGTLALAQGTDVLVLGVSQGTGELQFVLDARGTVQSTGAFTLTAELTVPLDILRPDCSVFMNVSGSGNFQQRTVAGVTLEIGGSANGQEGQPAYACSLVYSGTISLP